MAEIGAKRQKIIHEATDEDHSCSSYGKERLQKRLYTFLLYYKATPHSTTGFPPSELLFNRLIRTKLPQVVTVCDRKKDAVVQLKDERAKTKMKQYAD